MKFDDKEKSHAGKRLMKALIHFNSDEHLVTASRIQLSILFNYINKS